MTHQALVCFYTEEGISFFLCVCPAYILFAWLKGWLSRRFEGFIDAGINDVDLLCLRNENLENNRAKQYVREIGDRFSYKEWVVFAILEAMTTNWDLSQWMCNDRLQQAVSLIICGWNQIIIGLVLIHKVKKVKAFSFSVFFRRLLPHISVMTYSFFFCFVFSLWLYARGGHYVSIVKGLNRWSLSPKSRKNTHPLSD